MSRPKPPESSLRSLLHLLWRQPLWAVPFALFFGTLFGATAPSYVSAYRLSLVFTYTIGLAGWVTCFFVIPRLPVAPDAQGPSGFQIGFAYGSINLAASFAAALIIHLWVMPGFLGSPREVLVIGMYSLLFITLFGGIRFAMVYHQKAVERARAVEEARAELAQAELRALRAQIHPHFLFNTLNAIASLIATNPAAAEDMITRLAELFRYALKASDREHAPLGEELEFLRGYLAVERVRFGERLRIEEAVEPGLESVPVPTLLLQPIVENAVRYGVSSRLEGGTVRLAAGRRDGALWLEVADDGPGLDGSATPPGTGFGLHAVRERLRAAGHLDALSIESNPGRGTRVRITLPLGNTHRHRSPGGCP